MSFLVSFCLPLLSEFVVIGCIVYKEQKQSNPSQSYASEYPMCSQKYTGKYSVCGRIEEAEAEF